MVFYPGGTYRSESCDVALQESGVLDHRLTQQRTEWRSAAPAHCKSIKQNNNLQQFRPQIEKKLQCWNRKINTGGQFYPVIPLPAHTLTSMSGLVQYKRRQLHTNTSDKEKYREQKQTFIYLFILNIFLFDYVTLWDRPLYLVTTAELTQSGSSKSTLKLLLLLTDRRTALGASGGSEEADRRWDGETGERSAGSVSSIADTAR